MNRIFQGTKASSLLNVFQVYFSLVRRKAKTFLPKRKTNMKEQDFKERKVLTECYRY